MGGKEAGGGALELGRRPKARSSWGMGRTAAATGLVGGVRREVPPGGKWVWPSLPRLGGTPALETVFLRTVCLAGWVSLRRGDGNSVLTVIFQT